MALLTGSVRAEEGRELPALRVGDGLSVQLGYRLQLQHEERRGPEHVNGAEVRRSRLTLTLSALDGRLRAHSQWNLTAELAEAIDAELAAERSERFGLRLGFGKLPFGLRWQDSSARLAFVDWPRVVTIFGGRALQAALRASGGPVEAELALTAGTALRPSNGQLLPQIYGLGAIHRLDARGGDLLKDAHPELAGRVVLHRPGFDVALSVLYDLDPRYRYDDALRVAAEASTRHGPLRAHAGGYLMLAPDAKGELIGALGGALLEVYGFLATDWTFGARYDVVARSGALRRDIQRTGSNESIVRADHEATLALGWRWARHQLKWTNDISLLRRAREGGNDSGFRFRSQLQISL